MGTSSQAPRDISGCHRYEIDQTKKKKTKEIPAKQPCVAQKKTSQETKIKMKILT